MRSHLSRVCGAVGTVAITVGGLAAVAAPASAAPPTSSGSATESVIVVLADQLDATPPDRAHAGQRTVAARRGQDAVLSRLAGSTPKNVKHFTVGNAFSATVTADQAAALSSDPAVASVSTDQPVQVAPPTASQAAAAAPAAAAAASAVNPAACSTNPNKPLLEPEALSTIRARSDNPTAKTAAALGIDGSGVKVAFIADGINPNNAGFLRKNGKSSIVDYKDFYGDGPNAPTSGAEAFGDASAVSAQGNVVYDVAQFANPNVVTFPGGHCYIRIVGVAPGANVVALKAGSELLPNSSILQAIDYAVTTAHVDVLNESFGSNVVPDSSSRNTIELFDRQATKAGVTVTVSTGDAGITSTIGNPATDPLVISAGASTDSRLYEQTGYALATRYGNGRWLDDNISSLSSAGITQNGRTIDLSAPGEADWAVCDASGNFTGCTSYQGSYVPIEAFGGTSQAAPFTAGVAALVIQAYRKTHGGTSPTPAVVKQIITSTTKDLGLPGDEQGTGRLDARAAVEAALSYPGGSVAPAGVSSQLALSTDQLNLTATPGTTATGSVTVRNVGKSPVVVLPSTRRYITLSQQTQTVTVPAANADVIPYPTSGAPWTAQKVTFTVPGGTDQLDARIRWASGAGVGGTGGVVRMSLFTPDGTYAANTRPQGGPAPANYGDIDVRQPAAGTWTAVLYTQQTGGVHFAGPVTLQTTSQRAVPVGLVRPALFALAPGASRAVSVSLPVPAVGGDAVYTVSLATSTGQRTAVPVVIRALVPTRSGSGMFAGTITGGNARSGAPAQTFGYSFDVPRGQKDLDVSLTLASDPNDSVTGILVDPNGETPSIVTNTDPSGKPARSLQNTVANPIAGRWRYVVDVANPVSGTEFTQNFIGTVRFNAIRVAAVGVPNSAHTTLAKGTAVTARVTITNPGPAAIAVQTDARTDPLRVQQLAPQFASSTVPLPLSVEDLSNIPAFLVPPDTSRITLSAASTVPAQVELSSPAFGIDVFGDLKAAQTGNTISTAQVGERAPARVAQGLWTTYVQEIGPFGDAGAPAGSSTLVATARTRGFDPAVSTTTGDPFLQSVDPTASPGTPVIVAPGASATITVTITPTAAKGTTVTGVLHLVTPPQGAPRYNGTGDVLATLPYAYTVR